MTINAKLINVMATRVRVNLVYLKLWRGERKSGNDQSDVFGYSIRLETIRELKSHHYTYVQILFSLVLKDEIPCILGVNAYRKN